MVGRDNNVMKGRTLVLIIFCVNVNSTSFSGRLFSLVSTSDKSASFETKKKMHNKRIRVLCFCLIAFWHFVWPIPYTPHYIAFCGITSGRTSTSLGYLFPSTSRKKNMVTKLVTLWPQAATRALKNTLLVLQR